MIPASWWLSPTGHSIQTRLERKRDTGRKPYQGVENDEHDSQGCQGLKPIQVFVSQDPVVLTGDQANLVDHQLFWEQREESEISDEGREKERFPLKFLPHQHSREKKKGPKTRAALYPLVCAHSLTQEGHTQKGQELQGIL